MSRADLLRSALVAGLAAAGLFLLPVSQAGAVLDHSVVEGEFSPGPGCLEINDIAVAESTGNVYVSCRVGSGLGGDLNSEIRKFDLAGNPVAFTGVGTHIEGNAITQAPGDPQGKLGLCPQIAVDNTSANNGYIYVAQGHGTCGGSYPIEVFKPSGDFATSIQVTWPSGAPDRPDVTVGPEGHIFSTNHQGLTEEFDTSFHHVRRLYYFKEVTTANAGTQDTGEVGVSSDRSIWIRHTLFGGSPVFFTKYGPDQLSSNISLTRFDSSSLKASVEAAPSSHFTQPFLTGSNAVIGAFAIDRTNDSLYVNRINRVEVYSGGDASEAPHQLIPPFDAGGTLTNSDAIAVTSDHRVYVSKGTGVVIFGPGNVLPDVRTPRPAIDDIGHTSATLGAEVDLAGGPEVTDCKLQIGQTTEYLDPEVPCSPGAFAADQTVTAEPSGLTTGTTYRYRFRVVTANGVNYGIGRTFVPAHVLGVKTLPVTEVDDHGARLHGSLDPDGIPTTFRFEYGPTDSYGFDTAELSAGTAAGATPVNTAVADLPSGTTWHYRLAATNAGGTTYGSDMTFRTASVPDIGGVRASDVAASSALLSARIDPVGYDTAYRFEYGTTPEYGSRIPVPDGQIAGAEAPTSVSEQLTGLTPGVTYHFRVVASNEWGSSASPDTTFDYSPPTCPNDHVRQETRSSYLPDCRAYELVSPGVAGPVRLNSSHVVVDTPSRGWVVNTGRATSPSRFAYFGELGVMNGTDATNYFLGADMYVASRGTGGWRTTLPGIKASEALSAVDRECSESLSLCVARDPGNGFAGLGSDPYRSVSLFSVDGTRLGELPTTAGEVPNGRYFDGVRRPSPDFSHFLFSSTDVAFVTGAVVGGLGSAYDNVTGTGAVSIVSLLPGGANIPLDGAADAIEFPGVSPDGSHVLMETPASNGPSHLYMRVGGGPGGVTYDVSRGAGVAFAGITRDGSRVYFVTSAQLTGDDTDGGADLYMWTEAGDSLTRVSQGGGAGNGTDCSASWISACAVAALDTDRDEQGNRPSVPGLDDRVAAGSGDIYFYSPENLDPSRPGIRGQRNLYVFRGGSVRLVAILDPGTEIRRLQISPDGSHAALLTASRMTAYDNRGFRQMYVYEPDSGQILCASCNPSGLPPSADVEASEGGPFMADDGRTFFTSLDSLVDRDNNGAIRDVYEYVGGRPQLITSGSADADSTSASILGPPSQFLGLEAVSRDGRDVYFSTYETLVDQDQNGNFVKFYDARTGGGFPSPEAIATCAAADECHGDDSSRPAPATVVTGGDLGARGNLSPPKRAKKKRKARRKKKRARRACKQRRRGRCRRKRSARKRHRTSRGHSRTARRHRG